MSRPKLSRKIHVGTAGAGKSAGEFAEAQRAAKRHGADGEPDDEQPKGRGERFGHACGREKDADSDRFAGDDRGGGAQAELAAEAFV